MADLIERDAALAAVNYSSKMRNCIEECIKDIPAVNQWIPCSERLPKFMKRVQICIEKKVVSTGYFTGIEWVIKDNSCMSAFKYMDYAVTHWMPLPEPPESEVQECSE